jgi:hypothetical protein
MKTLERRLRKLERPQVAVAEVPHVIVVNLIAADGSVVGQEPFTVGGAPDHGCRPGSVKYENRTADAATVFRVPSHTEVALTSPSTPGENPQEQQRLARI